MAHTYKDIFSLHTKYVDYLLSRSLLSHQYIHNIVQSGADVESEVREIFSQLLPDRYKVTHGYIVWAPNQVSEPGISPQVDMIIVDTLVPHSILTVDKKAGLEIVPREAVVGIFELKRTLSATSLNGSEGAITHIQQIKASTGIIKNSQERYGPGGIVFANGLSGGYYWNPILGVIGLDMDDNIIDPKHFHCLENFYDQFRQAELDVVASFKGCLCAVRNNLQPTWFRVANPRQSNDPIDYLLLDTQHGRNQADIIARMFGYVLGYLYSTCGNVAPVNNYFFNQTLMEAVS